MKLAEALLLRSDLQKKITQIATRIRPYMIVRNGVEPQEDPKKLLAQLRNANQELEHIIVRINKTNMETYLQDGRSLMEGLAERDALKNIISQLRQIRQAAQISSQSYNDLRATIKISDLQSEIDQMGRAFREIDTQIQGINWTTELK